MPKSPSEALSPDLLEEFDRTFHRIFRRTASIAPSARAIELTEDVRLERWRATVHKGVYFIPDSEADACDGTRDLVLYAMDFSSPSTVAEVARLIDQGKARQGDGSNLISPENPNNDTSTRGDASDFPVDKQHSLCSCTSSDSISFDAGVKAIGISFKPLRVSSREQPFGVHEIAVWATYADLRRRHKRAMAEALLEQSYTPTTVATEPISEDLPRQDLIKLPTVWAGKSKVTESLPAAVWGEDQAVDVSGKTEAPIEVLYRIEDDTELQTSKPMNQFDKTVLMTIGSMYRKGIRVANSTQIAKNIAAVKRPSPNLVRDVTESILKQSTSTLIADMTEEAKRHNVDVNGLPATSATYRGHVLNVDSIEAVNANGERETMWRFLDEPWFFSHDRNLKNIIAVPMALLEDVSAKVRADRENILIRDYLIRRINWMQRADSRAKPHVRYSSIKEACDIKGPLTRNREAAFRKRAIAVAESLAASPSMPSVVSVKEYNAPSESGRKVKTGLEFTLKIDASGGCKKS